MVNIFTDLYYLTFVQELNKTLSGWQPTILPNSTCAFWMLLGRVEDRGVFLCCLSAPVGVGFRLLSGWDSWVIRP